MAILYAVAFVEIAGSGSQLKDTATKAAPAVELDKISPVISDLQPLGGTSSSHRAVKALPAGHNCRIITMHV